MRTESSDFLIGPREQQLDGRNDRELEVDADPFAKINLTDCPVLYAHPVDP